ncbi:MAG: diacylglycerol kinase family protein [bacterium]|nr:diacylglycerol kinase family protein [bacterium]
MYYYIYDAFVQGSDYVKDLGAIETRLADFGITGNIGRLSLFRDAGELIADEVRRGVKTVVVVGNDATVRKVMGAVVANKATLGFIPLGKPNTFARLFGVPYGVAACDVLARRIVVSLDVGKVNGRYFLSRVCIPEAKISIRCDNNYAVHSEFGGKMQVRNIGWVSENKELVELADPRDGMLETVIDARVKRGFFRRSVLKRSTIPMRTLTIESHQPIQAFVDEEKYAQPRFEISILPQRLRVIAGRERLV